MKKLLLTLLFCLFAAPSFATETFRCAADGTCTIISTGTTAATLPSGTHTLAPIDGANTWSALQGFNLNDFQLNGSTSGSIKFNAPAVAGSNTITWPAGTTDFSATGGTSQVVQQATSGGAFTVGQLGFNNLTGSATSAQLPAGVLLNYMGGCTLSNDGTTPNTVLDIAACTAYSDDNTTTMIQTAAFTKTTGSWAVGTGNGGLDAGSVAINTWYYVFQIERTDTGLVGYLFSTSATSPTLPASYTEQRLIGAFKTDGSANIIAFIQYGRKVFWLTPVLDVNDAAVTTTATLETLGSVPPALNVMPIGRCTWSNLTHAVLISSPAVNDNAPTDTVPFSAAPGFDQLDVTLTGGVINSACSDVVTNTSGQIRARSSSGTGTLAIVTRGWVY